MTIYSSFAIFSIALDAKKSIDFHEKIGIFSNKVISIAALVLIHK